MPNAAPAPAPAPVSAASFAQAPIADAKPEVVVTRVKAHDRAMRVRAKLAESEGSEGNDETSEREKEPAKAAEPAAPSPPVVDDAEKRRAERAERISKAQERERAEDRDRRTKKRASDGGVSNAELEKLRKRVAELEPHEAVFSSEEALLAAAEAKGLSAEKLVQWMRTRLSDPAAVAKQHAKSEADKLREEIAELRKSWETEREERKAERERQQQEQSGIQKAMSFLDKAKTSTSSHPLTAQLVSRHGEKGLIAFANQFVAPLLPKEYSVEQLHDHVEQLLDEVQVGGPGPTGNSTNGTSHSTKHGAAQPVTTLSNGIASERVSVTEETPLHRLPRRQRIQRLKETLGSDE